MTRKARTRTTAISPVPMVGYDAILTDVVRLLETARRAAARTVNAVMTATYWEIGRRIVEYEQGGRRRAEYGAEILHRLARDLTERFGRGFGVDHLELMRAFYLTYPPEVVAALIGGKSESALRELPAPSALAPKSESLIRISDLRDLARAFPLSWTHYVHLIRRTSSDEGRRFYEAEALRGGWTVRQLDRQIGSQFYERTALSRNKAAMLKKGQKRVPEDAVTAEQEIKDPYVLEFLGLRDEYSESELEDALIRHLEAFLLELGGDFTFVARQRRLRIGDDWFRIDLLFYHRRLRCLVIIDLKLDRFTHADAGQMHVYLNYARQHWTHPDENPPVGLILCAEKNEALARYALDGLPNKVVAAQYRTALPDEKLLAAEIDKTRAALEHRVVSAPRGRGDKATRLRAPSRSPKHGQGPRR